MGKMDPAAEDKWSGQESGKGAPDAGAKNEGNDGQGGPAPASTVRQTNPGGKGLNPEQKGPAQPTKDNEAIRP